ncbi:MAG: DUF3429 domain-containing protein [Pseudomonadota bacterium]
MKLPNQVSARVLGFGGLVPFVVFAALSLVGPEGWHDWVSRGLIAYGAVILSFLGGITWGLAVTRQRARDPLYLASMAPFFAGWVALLLPVLPGLLLLMAAFLGALVNDLLLKRAGLSPGWFFSMRLILTAVVVASLAVAAFGL